MEKYHDSYDLLLTNALAFQAKMPIDVYSTAISSIIIASFIVVYIITKSIIDPVQVSSTIYVLKSIKLVFFDTMACKRNV